MKTLGIYEAKTHFSEVIDEVVDGETVVITRHGHPVARIVPEPPDKEAVKKKIDEWFEFRNRRGISLGDLTIRDLIDEGKR
jgi:prevent-host-death family protein